MYVFIFVSAFNYKQSQIKVLVKTKTPENKDLRPENKDPQTKTLWWSWYRNCVSRSTASPMKNSLKLGNFSARNAIIYQLKKSEIADDYIKR